MPSRPNKVEVKRVDLPSRVMFWAVLLVRISIRKGYGNEKVIYI